MAQVSGLRVHSEHLARGIDLEGRLRLDKLEEHRSVVLEIAVFFRVLCAFISIISTASFAKCLTFFEHDDRLHVGS